MRGLQPLSALYALLAARRRAAAGKPPPNPVPLVVVGNLVVGGSGKTPTVIALVQALQRAGRQPGVVSRGHGRAGSAAQPVRPHSRAADVGDEPLLICRRTGVPVWVGRDRRAAAAALCRAQPQVDVLVADDGLQHAALARDAELLVFDERGAGNGLLLPAGPLREPLPASLRPTQRLLYNAPAPSTRLPGALAQRRLGPALRLADWQAGNSAAGVSLATLRGMRLLAMAGIAAPERFFGMLEAAGLRIERLPLPDHFDHATVAWPAGTADVLTTEKDAVKLDPARCGPARVWVVGLDFGLPDALVQDLLHLLSRPPAP